MKTVRRLLYREIVASVAFVTLAFMALFYFIAVVEELERLRKGAPAWHGALLALYGLPTHLYDVFPITVLIGTVFSLTSDWRRPASSPSCAQAVWGPAGRWAC
jgi:lipopolysaccharide export system permease protein